jgi:hypothetical protein
LVWDTEALMQQANFKVKEGEICRVCSMHGMKGDAYRVLVRKSES